MLKLFPLPPFLESYAKHRLVNVALFGNGVSMTEWGPLCASFWRHHAGFLVNIVQDSARADVLAVHGPFTAANWSFFVRWFEGRSPTAKILVVGAEVGVADGMILDYQGRPTPYAVDLLIAGHPPSPGVLKAALIQMKGDVNHV